MSQYQVNTFTYFFIPFSLSQIFNVYVYQNLKFGILHVTTKSRHDIKKRCLVLLARTVSQLPIGGVLSPVQFRISLFLLFEERKRSFHLSLFHLQHQYSFTPAFSILICFDRLSNSDCQDGQLSSRQLQGCRVLQEQFFKLLINVFYWRCGGFKVSNLMTLPSAHHGFSYSWSPLAFNLYYFLFVQIKYSTKMALSDSKSGGFSKTLI